MYTFCRRYIGKSRLWGSACGWAADGARMVVAPSVTFVKVSPEALQLADAGDDGGSFSDIS
eukprot:6273150-Pyramimonas_sp.AAC.1